jgi:hypothetical protein
LASSQPGQFVAALPRHSDARFGSLRFDVRCSGLLVQLNDRVGQPMNLAFESGDEVRGVASVEVVGEEADVDVRLGDWSCQGSVDTLL